VTTMIGISTTGIHAPTTNFDTTTTSSTMKVAIAPIVFTTWPNFHPGSRSFRWCLTMPHCERVNPVNTPTA